MVCSCVVCAWCRVFWSNDLCSVAYSFRSACAFIILQAPFDDRAWWRAVVEAPLTQQQQQQQQQSQGSCCSGADVAPCCGSLQPALPSRIFKSAAAFDRLVALLRPIFWRHGKEAVVDQLRLPPLHAVVHTLEFSSVERVWYNNQRTTCGGEFRRLLSQLETEVLPRACTEGTANRRLLAAQTDVVDLTGTIPPSSPLDPSKGDRLWWMDELTKSQWRRVLLTLGRLRQACCHPQVCMYVTYASHAGSMLSPPCLGFLFTTGAWW